MLNNIHILSRAIVGRKGFEPPQPVTVLDPKSSASQPIAPPPHDLMCKLYLWINPEITFTSKIFVDPKGIEPSTLSLQGRNASLGTCKPKFSDPVGSRTRDPEIKSFVLYPTELRGRSY